MALPYAVVDGTRTQAIAPGSFQSSFQNPGFLPAARAENQDFGVLGLAPKPHLRLTESVAALALKSGVPPRQVIQLLAQGVFTQQQTRTLSFAEKQTALPGLLQYAQAIAETAPQQRFVE
ncbi:MAG: hypothetical protein HC772_15720 [Leptolyngbyaceae cyanobacterium CRU_2_3]|nr:hypothetical protein [Leptolyngbyaceae cyanobacterium CRU_2_3]